MKTLKSNLPNLTAVLFICAMLSQSGIMAQIRVTRVAGPDQLAGKNGIVYTLPRTQVIAELRISKSQQFAGPLAAYAAEFLGIDEVITKDALSYSIESAAILTMTEPDPGHIYLIEKEDKQQGEVWISFGKEPPVLNMEVFQKTVGPAGFSAWNKDLYMTADAGRLFRKYTDSPTREITDTIIRKVSIDTLVFEEKIFKHSREEYSDREKAQDAADKINQIEHDKYNLLIGYPETAYSKEALEYMINELEKQRLEYLKLFTGVTVNETLKFSYPVIPEPARENQDYQVAGFSKTAGMTVPEGQNQVILSLKPDEPGEKIEDTAPGDGQAGSGLVYLLPKSFHAVLSYQGKELAARRIEVLQLGMKMALPQSFKRIEFDLQTGTVRSVILE
jgi:hypothetical protein